MSNITRSAKGAHVDFGLLAIKAQLAAKPVPAPVQQRQVAIAERDGQAPPASPAVDELLRLSADAAAASAAASTTQADPAPAPKRK